VSVYPVSLFKSILQRFLQSSFDAVLTWMQNLKQYADQDIVIAIAGNKCDLEDKRKVQFSG